MSDTAGGWFLTHGDGEVHGPYTLAALVQAARLGNISDSTQVRHQTLTKDQWVPAVRVRRIGEAIGSSPQDADSPPSAAKSSPPATTPQSRGEIPESNSTADVAVAVETAHRLGRGKRALVVPETFGGAAVALFDFRFRRFITPWIVAVTWATSVVVALFAFIIFTFVFLVQPIAGNAPTGANVTAIEETEPLETGNSRPAGWEFRPPTAVETHLGRFLTFGGIVLAGGFSLLYLRVLLEGAIVVFRIATDLSEVRTLLKEK